VERLAGRPPRAHLRPSKGVHLCFAAATLPIQAALVFPTGDGRVLFAVPWHNHVVVGTTDADYHGDIDALACEDDEAGEILAAVNRFFGLGLGEDAILSRWAGVRPLVAPGGSDKTSTKDLTASVLAQKYRVLRSPGNWNNEIGVPLTLFRLGPETEIAVLEMGMHGPGDIALLAQTAEPRIGVVTNVAPIHLARMQTLERIARAKSELVAALPPTGLAVLTGDVTVLTGFPNHPTGTIPPEYRGQLIRRELVDGVHVVRTPIYAAANQGVVRRAANYLSYAVSAASFGPSRHQFRCEPPRPCTRTMGRPSPPKFA